ncbi:MAG: [FeFe] hydrogenase, group A, partial [Clostridia bacterium]|nr:[FeFe] hydrogenase, group A [Clostridia bacterium]
MINLTINGKQISVAEGTTILEAARQTGIKIPTLCYLKKANEIGACRICVVEVKGARSLVASCVYPVSEGMEITTNSKRVLDSRKTTLELLLSNHEKKCLSCVRSQNCELQALSKEFGCEETHYAGEANHFELDLSTPYLVRDNNKCILCRRCSAACKNYQSVGVIGANARGFATHIGTYFSQDLSKVPCVACGQCINVCPTGALRERDEIPEVIAALNDKSKHVVAITAPAVRVAIGEEFGYPVGTNTEGKMVAATKQLGFAQVYDVNMTADLTIMEEGFEFIGRLQNGGVLPMLTSCSPAWIKFVEHYYPDLIPNLSTCKSPQQMFGALMKSYYAEKQGIRPEDMVVVTVMPCTAKKFEVLRDHQNAVNGLPDVDITITTREFARMVRRAGIRLQDLPAEEGFDPIFGIASGAAHIFGATGGVMEAALRTVYEVVTGKELKSVDFCAVRGTDAIKEATIKVGDLDV